MSRQTRIFACGGCGLSRGADIEQYIPRDGSADVVYIDTSDANKGKHHTDDNSYFIPLLRGSGSNRKKNAGVIAKAVKEGDILSLFEPADFNIIVYSAAGGSGSVIGPVLVGELLKQRKTVVSVVVGETDSDNHLNNTIGTLKTLESQAILAEKPAIIDYHENKPGITIQDVDDDIREALVALVELSSQKNEYLDVEDLTNFVQYTNVIQNQLPQLTSMFIVDDRKTAGSIPEPIAIASLYSNVNDHQAFGNASYRTFGVVPEDSQTEQLHFVLNTIGINEILKGLEDKEEQSKKASASRTERRNLISSDDDIDDSGIVF